MNDAIRIKIAAGATVLALLGLSAAGLATRGGGQQSPAVATSAQVVAAPETAAGVVNVGESLVTIPAPSAGQVADGDDDHEPGEVGGDDAFEGEAR
jgi:hypothetical protein